MMSSFRDYIEEHKDDIRALQVLYSRPYKERLTFTDVKELAQSHRAATQTVDPREALARLRDAGQVQGAWLGRKDAHRPRLGRSLHPAPGRRASPLPRPGGGTLRRLADAARSRRA